MKLQDYTFLLLEKKNEEGLLKTQRKNKRNISLTSALNIPGKHIHH